MAASMIPPGPDLKAMRAAAEAATPRLWQVSGCRVKLDSPAYHQAQAHAVGPDGDDVALVFYEPEHHTQHWADARHIAAWCPANALAVLNDRDAWRARAEKAEARVAELEGRGND